jgi:cytochrome P450
LPLPATVIAELLGVPADQRAEFMRWELIADSADPAQADLAAEASGHLIRILREIVDTKTRAPADERGDLLSALISMRGEDRLDDDEVVAMAFLLLATGAETTFELIGNCVLALLTHPEQMAAVRADASLVTRAIEETLRNQAPIDIAIPRFALEDLTLAGVEIAKGDVVVLAVGSANRDSARFADPDTFDIRHDTTGHLAFGHGIHYCIGEPLARLEGEIGLRALLDRLPDLRLGVKPDELTWSPNPHLRGVIHLPVTFTPSGT